MIIAVSGNMGSGKTTLAKQLVKLYNFVYVPWEKSYTLFLDDFFDNFEEFFLPTQLSFLISKAVEIKHLSEQGNNIVIDRSLLEDINVFAKYWIEHIVLEERIKDIYFSIANFIIENTPKPNAYFVSICPPNICKQRISQRKLRTFEQKYPSNHIESIAKEYEDLSFEEDVFIVKFDGHNLNFNDSSVMEECFDYIFKRIKKWNENELFQQLSFFDDNTQAESIDSQKLFNNYISIKFPTSRPLYYSKTPEKKHGYIYLAAPFSAIATEPYAIYETQLSIPIGTQDYGIIPKHYRKALIKIANSLKKRTGYDVLLPHRDINNWGNTQYSEEYLMQKITEKISNATAIVAIPNVSLGVHIEIGYGLCRNIPIVIFSIKNKTNEFWMKALATNKNVSVIEVTNIDDIPKKLNNDDIIQFMQNEPGETV